MRIALSIIAIVVAAFALWGVGASIRCIAKAPQGRWPVSIGIGLAALICVGGILNLAHIAYRPVIWCVIAAAIAVAAIEARRTDFSTMQAARGDNAIRWESSLAALFITLFTIFTIATQLPPRIFNFHDDLQKYFAHPVRMLQTGTLAGGPLSALGSETLGGMAFLHGIVLSFAPLPYINGVDAVFGLFVLMLIAAAAACRRFGKLPGAVLAVLLVAAINPQYVNVSALYIGATLMATAVMLVADEDESPSPILLGLVYAGMIAIKPTFVLFAAPHLALSVPSVAVQLQSAQRAAKWFMQTAFVAAVALAPWLILYLPTYLSHGTFVARLQVVRQDSDGVTLFSAARSLDGDSILSYTIIAALAAIVAVVAVASARAQSTDLAVKRKSLGLAAGAAAGFIAYLVVILYLSRLSGFEFSARYAVPFLLGSCVIAILAAPAVINALPQLARIAIPTLGVIAIIALFTPGAVARAREAINSHAITAFADATKFPDYEPYIQSSLSDQAHQKISAYQSKVPAGASLIVWIDTPYWLDYARNPVTDVDTAGTATPWAHVPSDAEYFLWQYRGYAVRTQGDYEARVHEPGIGARERLIAERSFALANLLSNLANHSEVVANDDQYVLFKLPRAAANPAQ